MLAVGFTFTAFTQNVQLKGTVTDTINHTSIDLASIAVITQKDSLLVKSTRSNAQGKFQLTNLKDGDYFLLVSYPKFVDFVEKFSIHNGQADYSGNVVLTPVSTLLDEIVISQPPIRIKGDTTEYIADSFKVRQNATAEELLKELPGIQVDKDGKIMAQGKKVEKVLVEGDEFFSDDPTVATRNLRADAIQKVQVYDKKSDQAAFTGIDDGQSVKTIDLKLKDNAKNGYFGKASVAGLDKYYNATAMLNAFKAKRKFSVFGVASNTDQTGLSFGDQSSLGFGGTGGSFMGANFSGGGGVMMVSGGSSGSNGLSAGNSYGQGLPESIKAGLHYGDKWNDGKNSAGGDYLFNQINLRSGGNTFSQNTLLDSVYYSRSSSNSHSSKIQQALNSTIELNLDSSSQVKITLKGNVGRSDSRGENRSEALSEKMMPVNSSLSNTTNHNTIQSLSTNAFYRKRFKKQGRTMSININQQYNNSISDGLLDNVASFFDGNGNQTGQQITDQNKVNTATSQVWEIKASYTNPLGKKSILEVNYGFNYNDNYQKNLSYNKDLNGKYTELVDSLSSIFDYLYNTHTGGLNYRYNGKKINFSAGGSLSSTHVDQKDRFKNTNRSYGYTNLFPRANLQYKFNSFSNVNINYSGSTSQPTIDQLQPLLNNSDPMNILIGNPNLKQSFSNSMGINYNSFQMLKDQYIFLGVNITTTANQINSSYTIDSKGRKVTQYINVNGNYTASVFGGFSRKLGKTWRLSFSPSTSVSQNSNYINGVKNLSKSFQVTPSLSFSKYNAEKYDLSFNYSPSYNKSKSSISSVASQNYWIQNLSFNGRYTLPLKIDIASDISYQYRQKLNAADTKNQVVIWNAYAEKRFLKKEQLTLRFSINDILNQNSGYERTIQPTSITERNYLTFKRYALFTLTYNFNTTGTGGGAASPKGRVITF